MIWRKRDPKATWEYARELFRLEDECDDLKRQLEDERQARAARTDADFAQKSQKYREDKAKMKAPAKLKAQPKPHPKTSKR